MISGSAEICFAEEYKFIIAPFGGVRFGGDLELSSGTGDSSIDSSPAYGLKLAIPIRTSFIDSASVELIYSRQDSEVSGEAFGGGDLDFAIEYFLLGAKYYFYEETIFNTRKFKPYIAGAVGMSRFSSDDGDIRDDAAFALNASLGGEFYINDRFGLFIEGSFYTSVVDKGGEVICREDGTCAYNYKDSSLFQGEFVGGLVIRI